MKYIIIIIALLLIGNIVYGGTRHRNVNDKDLIENGNLFDSIAQILVVKPDGEYKASCVIISKDHILTSAHIVCNESVDNIFIIHKQKKYVVLKSYIPKEFCFKFHHDIAVLKILGFIDIKYPELYKNKDEIGKIAYLGGYGAFGTGDGGYNSFDFMLRVGTNKVEYISGDMLMCDLSIKNHTKYELITCPGDSGGGLFIDHKLAGVNSALFGSVSKEKPTGKYGQISGHTRISDYAEWIEGIYK